jgi:hypothetical protein
MYAPGTISPPIYLVFAEGRAMAAVCIAERRFVLRPYTRPWPDAAAMAHQACKQGVFFPKIPYHKAFDARWQAHVDQNTIVGTIAMLPAKF